MFTPASGTRNASASAFAAATPIARQAATSRAVGHGELRHVREAHAAFARSSSGAKFRRCSRDGEIGTTPPRVFFVQCDSGLCTHSREPARRIEHATAVSSQELSSARITGHPAAARPPARLSSIN